MSSVPVSTVAELSRKLRSEDQFVLLDVREDWELDLARIVDDRLEVVPMSRLGSEGVRALPERARSKQAAIYVICHQGVRSAEVAAWLTAKGWSNVFSVEGGIQEYSRSIDPAVGSY